MHFFNSFAVFLFLDFGRSESCFFCNFGGPGAHFGGLFGNFGGPGAHFGDLFGNFGGPGAHFGDPGTHFEDFGDCCHFGDVLDTKVESLFEVIFAQNPMKLAPKGRFGTDLPQRW